LAYPVIKRRKRGKEDTKMIRHKGGHRADKGTYWNFSTGERVDISAESVLPGDGSAVYYKLPAAGILFMGPVLGLLYAAFLPFIGIAMVLKLVIQKIGRAVLTPVRSGASFGWRPSESYLAGKKKKGNGDNKKEAGDKGDESD
jgi:hypothetical protein